MYVCMCICCQCLRCTGKFFRFVIALEHCRERALMNISSVRGSRVMSQTDWERKREMPWENDEKDVQAYTTTPETRSQTAFLSNNRAVLIVCYLWMFITLYIVWPMFIKYFFTLLLLLLLLSVLVLFAHTHTHTHTLTCTASFKSLYSVVWLLE